MKDTIAKHHGNSRDDNHAQPYRGQKRLPQRPEASRDPHLPKKKSIGIRPGVKASSGRHANAITASNRPPIVETASTNPVRTKRPMHNDPSGHLPTKKLAVASISSAQHNDIFSASQSRSRPLPVKRPSKNPLLLPKREIPKEKQRAHSTKADNLSALDELDKELNISTDKALTCPYCHEEFPAKLSSILQKALTAIQQKDKQFELDHGRKETQHVRLRLKRKASRSERDQFCRLHYIELKIKPLASSEQYPAQIDFDLVKTRVKRLKSELDAILSGKESSTFRETALGTYENLGTHKARKTMGGISGFQETLPGYYGSKGAEVILDVLTVMYIHTGILTMEKTHPQLPVEYAQQILVPEVGYRLIREDLSHNPRVDASVKANTEAMNAKALAVMKDSSEYGHLLFPTDEDATDGKASLFNAESSNTDEDS